MSKPRSNSNWAQLNREQRELVEMWLFDERASYAEVRDRVKAQFGREVSLMSLSRFYQSLAPGRQVTDLLAAQSLSDAVASEKLNTDSMRSAAVKLIAKSTLKLACEKPDELKNLGELTRVCC
jgi:hypothetical protein